MAGGVVHQSNRAGAGSAKVTDVHVGEDFSVVQTVDKSITYSQTEQEKKLNLARLYVSKNRNDEDKFTVLISQAYGIGQFCLESTMMHSKYWKRLEDEVGDGRDPGDDEDDEDDEESED